MSYQDGTREGSAPRPMSETDRQWLEEALKGAMLDLSNRMQDITNILNSEEDAASNDLEEKERLLEELIEIVESIDQAKDLSSIGGLPTLLHLLSSPHPSLQWRAAEVVATCVQNNPDVQQAFFAGGVMPALWPLLDHPTVTCQIKGLLAISCQIRGHNPSLHWFKTNRGLAKIISLLGNSTDVRVGRKCLQILTHVLHHHPQTDDDSHNIRSTLPTLLTRLISDSDDGDVRSAALQVVQAMMTYDAASLTVLQQDSALVGAVQAVQCKLDMLPKDEWGSAAEEATLAKQLAAQLMTPPQTAPFQPPPSTANTTTAAATTTSNNNMQLMNVQQN